MCGLVAVLSTELNTFNHPYGKFFKQALFADTLRGFDSTGIMVMDTKKMDQPDVFKKALSAPDFLQLGRTNALLKDSVDWNIMVGHNRHATKGGVDHNTAHPFQIKDITLVHNGTIHNHRTLPNGHKFDVDSEAVCDAINDIGIEEVVRRVEGAFTFIWHDRRNSSINLVRNDERPLAFGKVKDKDTILMASEAGMLRWLAVRNGLELESILQPKPGELFCWWPFKDTDWVNNPDVKTLQLRPKNVYAGRDTYNNYSGPVQSVHGGGGVGKKQTATRTGGGNVGKESGTKTSQEKILSNDAMAILSDLLVAPGEEVCLVDMKWEPYPASKRHKTGRIIGKLEDCNDNHTAVIHGIDHSLWEGQIKGNFVYSTIMSAAYDTSKNPIIFLDNQDYCLLDPKDIPEHTTIDYSDDDNDEDSKEENKALTVITFRGYNGEKLSLREFERATKEGCAWCGGNIFSEDHEKTGWTHERQPVCKGCIRDHDLGEFLH